MLFTKSYIIARVHIITETGCWEWAGARDHTNYGLVTRSSGESRAHRLAYTLFVGPITYGQLVCHKCDNPPCCNPNHLFLGTMIDNILDCVEKGRHRSVPPAGWNKLPQAKIEEVVVLLKRGDRKSEIAKACGISLSQVYKINTDAGYREPPAKLEKPKAVTLKRV